MTNQKGYLTIILAILVTAVLVAAGSYFIINQKANNRINAAITEISEPYILEINNLKKQTAEVETETKNISPDYDDIVYKLADDMPAYFFTTWRLYKLDGYGKHFEPEASRQFEYEPYYEKLSFRKNGTVFLHNSEYGLRSGGLSGLWRMYNNGAVDTLEMIFSDGRRGYYNIQNISEEGMLLQRDDYHKSSSEKLLFVNPELGYHFIYPASFSIEDNEDLYMKDLLHNSFIIKIMSEDKDHNFSIWEESTPSNIVLGGIAGKKFEYCVGPTCEFTKIAYVIPYQGKMLLIDVFDSGTLGSWREDLVNSFSFLQ